MKGATARWQAAATAVMLSCVTACGHGDSNSSPVRTFGGVPLAPNVTCYDAKCSSYNVQPYVRTRSRYGIGCLGNVPPGTIMNPKLPPESYSATGIGKPGFPALTRSEAASVASIKRYLRSKTLRIAWVTGTSQGEREFIVFDAKDGPCEVWGPGYPVLNGSCNEYYEPGETPYNTHAGSGCHPSDGKRPWMHDNR